MATGATVPSSDVISAPIMHREQERAYTAFDALAIDRMGAIMTGEIADDALGVSTINEFLQAATRAESMALFSVAAATKGPIFTHVRRSVPAQGGGPLTPMEEVIAMAAATGGPLNICHVGSEAVGAIDQVLALIRGARTQGLNVTTEAYPYTAGSTLLGSVLFDKGWQEWIGGDYGDIEWPATGERLTAEIFERYRRATPNGYAIIKMIPQRTVDTAMADPIVMMAADAVHFMNGKGHPRGAGTFPRTLGVCVRKRKVLASMDAVRKMTLMPAQRLETIAPPIRNKGRVKLGADADLTLFEPATVIDRATFSEPILPSAGIPYVIVGGRLVVDSGSIVDGALPGKALRAGV